MNLRALLARLLEEPQIAVVRAPFRVYGRAAGGLLARGLAFAALFTAIPTLLLVLGLVGWVAGSPAARDRLSVELISTFPPLAGLIGDSLIALSDGAALASFVGIVGVIWTMSQFYGALDLAVARIYSDVPERSLLLRTARGLASVILVAGSVVGLVVLGSFALALDATSVAQDWPVGAVAAVLSSPVVLLVLVSLLVLSIYRAVPPRTPGWRAVGIPAATVGAVIVVLSRAFVLLVPWLVGVEALAGSLASAFVTLAWLSLIFQALLLGLAWVRVREEGDARAESSWSADLERAAAPAEPGGRRQ
jgi:uncharacterized BrkB/YihY/UPF0761 family membrane protein